MGRPLVLHHRDCADGFCAAFGAWLALGEAGEYRGVQYGEGLPADDLTGRAVYVLDFSYPLEGLLEMAGRAERVVVLDHHETAQAALASVASSVVRTVKDPGEEKLYVRFDLGKSGGLLAWEYFQPHRTVPWLVSYTMDRDLWRWALPCSRAINAAIASYPFTFRLWDQWDRRNLFMELRTEGEAILRYQGKLVESACRQAVEIEMAGHKVLSVNATVLMSEIGEKLAAGRPFAATYFVDGQGVKVWSLRSAPDGEDVGAIAKARGGGGHRHAAGFRERESL